MSDSIELILAALADGTPGLTAAAAECLAQAAQVSLERYGHATGVLMRIDGSTSARGRLAWATTTGQMARTWADPDEATELGACAIAVLLLHALTELTVVQRSVKGTGFDYWCGRRSDAESLFQGKTRLEVSGIGRGGDAAVNQREREKLDQLTRFEKPGVTPPPAIVVVVEFGTPRSRMTTK